MEEDDESKSRPSPEGSLSPDPPVELKTTVKSPPSPPSPRNGLELVASPPSQGITGGGSQGRSGGGGGREDCWSEEATEVLIDAWGERYLELKRGNLKQQHWKEVAEIVNTTSSSGKSPKTDIQCKNRIDTVKKKFKQEKAKIAAGSDNSRWIFFEKLETLIGGATAATTAASKALVVTPLSSRSSLYQRKAKSTAFKQQASVKRSGDSTRWHFRKRIAYETESESEPDLSADSADDSLPPPPPVKSDKAGDGGRRELGEVAMAIIGFAESYEKAETVKLKQLVELEKERMTFAKELELQRMQFFKSQMEMLRNIQENGNGERIITSQHSVKDNGNVS